jgi:MFS family permease
LLGVSARPAAPRTIGDRALGRIAEGIRYVVSDQILLGAMTLDLFAVFFGGAAALLPVFATDILQVGPTGFGLLRVAISVGSFAAMLIAVRRPPWARAGLALFVSIAGFGVGIIVFAVPQNFVLSFVALAFVGVCDGVSMVIRQVILRLIAPGSMRGRISAVRSVFMNSSNELGDFESGMLSGAVAAVWIGGDHTFSGGNSRQPHDVPTPVRPGGARAKTFDPKRPDQSFSIVHCSGCWFCRARSITWVTLVSATS